MKIPLTFNVLFCIVFITSVSLFAQNSPFKFEKEWKQYEIFKQNDKPRSAVDIVKTIYDQAKKNKEYPMMIKALFVMSSDKISYEDDDTVNLVNVFEDEIATAPEPARSIIASVYANLIWNYVQQNRWSIQKRTKRKSEIPNDLTTMSSDELLDKITFLFDYSIRSKEILVKTPLKEYLVLLNAYGDIDKYRIHLYDLLVNRALRFYTSGLRNSIEMPGEAFTVNTLDGLLRSNEFISKKFTTKDTAALHYKALLALQELERSHSNKSIPLGDAILLRLELVRGLTSHSNKNDQYFKTLTTMLEEFKGTEIESDVYGTIANYYYTTFSKDSILPNGNNAEQEALRLARIGKTLHPKTRGASKCGSIESTILFPYLKTQEMDYIYPNEPFLASVSYKNLTKVSVKIYPIDLKTSFHFPFTNEGKKKILESIYKSNTQILDKTISLLPTKNLRTATIEIPFEGLPIGNYLIVMNSGQDESINENDYTAISLVHSSELSLLHSRSSTIGISEFTLIDKKSGTTLQDAEVRFYSHTYDYKKSDYTLKFLSKEKTGIRGEFSFAIPSNQYNSYEYKAWIIRESDTVVIPITNPYFYPYKEQEGYRTFLYTDRAIYRPGQTVYFKGISVVRSKDNKSYSIEANKSMMVSFYDVNHTLLGKRDVVTNEFGSFNGSFTAPSSGLMGSMSIQAELGSINIQVEEYKRPKFEIIFPQIDSSYRFFETIQAKGTALSYTGAAIDNADVKYKVKRHVYFPYWRWWCRWDMPSYSNDSYIAEGTTKTDVEGKFIIPFVAYPDNAVSYLYKPVCTYSIEVDVTDNVGETRSNVQSIQVSNYAFTLSTTISDNALLNKSNNVKFTISSANINGGFEPAKGTYEFIKIPENPRPKIKRVFANPTSFLISKESFDSLFPYYDYKNNVTVQVDSLSWGKNEIAFNNQKSNEEFSIPTSTFESGKYALKVTSKDKYGSVITDYTIVTLYDETSQKSMRTSFFDVIPLKTTCKPSENAKFLLSSSEKDVIVYCQLEKNRSIIKRQVIKLSNSQEIIEFPVTEDDFGGYFVHFQSVSQSNPTLLTKYVSVPFYSKMLNVVTRTFRDKTKPGATEEWEFEVKDSEKQPINAEVLASMYDKSLDQFIPSYWGGLESMLSYYNVTFTTSIMLFPTLASQYNLGNGFSSKNNYYYATNYSDLQMYNLYLYQKRYGYSRAYKSSVGGSRNRTAGSYESEDALMPAPSTRMESADGFIDLKESASSPPSPSKKDALGTKEEKPEVKKEVVIRKNLNETAFFYPTLRTDSLGRFKVSFTIPEALTTWKFRAMAHTPSVQSGMVSQETITQKELMAQPALPRFLRYGDTVEIPIKVTNLTDSIQKGVASLELKDPITEKDISSLYALEALSKNFSIPAKQSVSVTFRLKVNDNFNALRITGIADAGKFSDAEQSVIPVLSNRMLVSETMPLPLKAKQERTFTFSDMIRGFTSSTMKPHRYTLEVTSNPIWYAIQALPFLMEYPHECAEQLFSRFYANSIGLKIVNDNPEIEKVFDVWKKFQSSAFQSNLQKNQELKNILLEETPWLNEGNDEQERKKRVALFFDRNTMNQSLASALRKLREMQLPNGSFTWFPGMKENRWITQHILAGLGKLRNLGIKNVPFDMYEPATKYVVAQIEDDYNQLIENKINLNQDNLYYTTLHSLYAVSFFEDVEYKKGKGFKYFLDQTKRYWRKKDFYSKGISALILHRFDEKKEAQLCFESLKEFSTTNDELGRFFKDNRAGWYWYQAPIENQALMIEVFNDVGKDSVAVEELKTWLLKQKQTTDWKTTKATTEAIYSLLGFGVKYINEKGIVSATVGEKVIDPKNDAIDPVEVGTGYYKVTWSGADIKESMATVRLSNPNNVVAWGALYWQYFEDMSKIQSSQTNLTLKKQLYIESMSGSKKVLTPVTSVSPIKIGDKIISRIEIKTDRNLEYVHLKDMRGSGFEPINVLSQYKWQDGFGYYESTKDVATHFFIDFLSKGSYVFEYPLRATTRGGFDNGIATIQCMYAPEFSSHSEGIRVQIK